MTLSCTASAEPRPHGGGDAGTDGGGRVAAAPDKTKIVYCKDANRRGQARAHRVHVPRVHVSRREARGRGRERVHRRSLPAISKEALKRISETVRPGDSIARPARPSTISPDGSTRSCGAGCSTTGGSTDSALYPLLHRINNYLVRWMRKKYKRVRTSRRPRGWQRIIDQHPGPSPTGHGSPPSDDQSDTSRMTGDCHVRICGGRWVRFPRATRHAAWSWRSARLARRLRVRDEARAVTRDDHRGDRENALAALAQDLLVGAERVVGRTLRAPPGVGADVDAIRG